MYNEEYVRKIVKEEQKRASRRNLVAAWYNPTKDRVRDKDTGVTLEPQSIYVGEEGGRPTWESEVMHVPTWIGLNDDKKKGLVDEDKAAFGGYTEEWANIANEALYTYRTAGTVTSSDFSAISVVNVLAELLNTDYKQHVLEQAVTVVNTPSLHLDIDTWTKFTAFQDVDEGEIVPTRKGAFSRQTIDLKKDVSHLMFTDEVQMRPYDHNIYQTHIQNAVEDLRRVKAKKIATTLEGASDASGADFGAVTGGLSDFNPYDVIGTVIDLIEANDGTVDTFASHDKAFRDFIGNSNVKGQFSAGANQEFGARSVNNVQGFPGISWYVDNVLTNTLLTVYDKKAVILAQGPSRTASYRNEAGGIDAYITRDYNASKVVMSGRIRNLTGVTA